MPPDDIGPAAPDMAQESAADRAAAVALFNPAWSLRELPARTPAEDFDLIHCTHASRWHWRRAGGPQEWAVVEGDLARLPAL
jgi:hypothetical protein